MCRKWSGAELAKIIRRHLLQPTVKSGSEERLSAGLLKTPTNSSVFGQRRCNQGNAYNSSSGPGVLITTQ